MVTRVLTFEHADGSLEHLTSQVPQDGGEPELLSWADHIWKRGADGRYRIQSVWVPDREEFDSSHFTRTDVSDLQEGFRSRLARVEAALGDLLVLLGERPGDPEKLEGTIARAKEALGHG